MFSRSSILIRIRSFLLGILFLFTLFSFSEVAFAKTPSEIRNLDEIEISADMHGRDLNGYEFVKADLKQVDLSESDLRGAVFNNTKLQGANLKGADMEDIVAFASDFEEADLRNANLTNALLMESSFKNTLIEGADFTNAVINRIQQKQLCKKAKGMNSKSGITTSYSLGC